MNAVKMTLPKATVILALQRYFAEVVFKDGQCPEVKDIEPTSNCIVNGIRTDNGFELSVAPPKILTLLACSHGLGAGEHCKNIDCDCPCHRCRFSSLDKKKEYITQSLQKNQEM